jgi:hypothetical protein
MASHGSQPAVRFTRDRGLDLDHFIESRYNMRCSTNED